MRKLYLKIGIGLSLSAMLLGHFAQACTGIIVGKSATADGSVIISRNEDFYTNNWNKFLVIRDAQTNPSGTTWKFGNGLQVPAPVQTMRYTATPDWDSTQPDTGDGPFEEQGVNSANVAVSATLSTDSNDKVKKLDPFVKAGIVESVIPSLILPQATSAREGIQLLGRYVDQYGAGEGNVIFISDPQEAWIFEIGSGHHWVAVRVPDDAYAVYANRLRVSGIDLDDTHNVIASRGLYEFVASNKLLAEPDRKNFNFAQAFGMPDDSGPVRETSSQQAGFYNVDREWLGMQTLTPSAKLATRQAQYPLFLKPDQPIKVQKIAAILRDPDYKGTPLENRSNRPIAVDTNLETHIIVLRPAMPKELVALSWQSFGPSKGSFLIPLYLNALTQIPPQYQQGTDQFSFDSALWNFRLLTTLPQTIGNKDYTQQICSIRANYEKQLFSSQAKEDEKLKALYQRKPQEAITQAGDYSYQLLVSTLNHVRKLTSEMLTDLAKSTEKAYKPARFQAIELK